MSFGWSAMTWSLLTTAVSTAVAVNSADTARSQGNKAADQAKANALFNQKQADEANNRANAKSPDTAAAMAANMLAGKSGQSGTMLTGSQGIDPNSLTLGKSTLLGG